MIHNSIRMRLLAAAGLMIVLALLASGVGITLIFQRHVENRVQQELEKHFIQLIAALDVQVDGSLKLSQDLADPRFTLPLSGLYWQVDLDGRTLARSRSLWDQKLSVPTPPIDAVEAHVHELAGPDGQNLFSLEKAVFLDYQGKESLFVVTVGLERGEISDTVLSMTKDVAPALAALGLVLLLATWFQISLGLRPLSVVERAVQGIHEGVRSRIDEGVAEELKPLVGKLNALLEANEVRNRVARQRAADLAHGLRTPLTILGSLSRTVEDAGLRTEAEKIRLQTEHMRQQVEQELAKALSSIEETPIWLNLRENTERLAKVVSMGVANPSFHWKIDIPKNVQIRLTRNDFNELLGNIFENAQKWGKSQVIVRLSDEQLLVDDDGPGVPPQDFDKLTERGFSTGNAQTSSGLGLAIARQLAIKNGLALRFGGSPLGGLSVQLQIPVERLQTTNQLKAVQA